MAYLDTILEPGEAVRCRASVSRIIYFTSVIFMIGFAEAIALDAPAIEAFLAAAAVISFIACWWRRLTTEIAVTDRRVVYKRGFIWRATFEMNLSKIERVHVRQSIAGCMFDYGDLVIRGTGSSSEPLRTILAPLQVRAAIH